MSVDEQRGLLVDEDDDEHAGIEPWALRKVDRSDFAREIGSGAGLASDVLAGRLRALTAVEIGAGATALVDRNRFVVRRVAAGFEAPEGHASKSTFRFETPVPPSVAP